MAARRSNSNARRGPLDRRHPHLLALPALTVGRLRLICGVHRAISGHLVANLLLVLFNRALPSGFDDFTRRPVGRHWSPMG